MAKLTAAEYAVDFAPDIEEKINGIVRAMGEYRHVNEFRLICMRSSGATAKAYARIWNLPKIWQKALNVGTFYVIEVLSEHFDPLSEEEKERVLIHELLHIPRTFSGALRPHGGAVKINARTVAALHRIYKERKKEMVDEKRGLAYAEEMF